MTSLRHPRFSSAVLVVYLAINIGVGTLHHHAVATASGRLLPADHSRLQLQSPTCTDNDGDEDACLLCRVLHLARVVPIVVRPDAVTGTAAEALPGVAIARPHFLETATHSRAPPLHVSDQ